MNEISPKIKPIKLETYNKIHCKTNSTIHNVKAE